MSDCIFCKIINQKIPSYKVYEDDSVLAFLDITQVTPGHTLVIPKQHVTDIFDYDEALAGEVFARIPKIAKALEKAFPEMAGLNIVNNNKAVAYQTVFHSHIHLIPRYTTEDNFEMHFKKQESSLTSEEFIERAKHISQQVGK